MRSVGGVGFWFVIVGFVVYSLFADGKLDLWLSRLLYDSSSQAFIWGKSEFVDLVLYRGHKWLMTALAFGVIVWGIRAVWTRRAGFGPKHLAVGILGTVCIIVAVGALKKITGIDCPWSIDEFGGDRPFIPMQEIDIWPLMGGSAKASAFQPATLPADFSYLPRLQRYTIRRGFSLLG